MHVTHHAVQCRGNAEGGRNAGGTGRHVGCRGVTGAAVPSHITFRVGLTCLQQVYGATSAMALCRFADVWEAYIATERAARNIKVRACRPAPEGLDAAVPKHSVWLNLRSQYGLHSGSWPLVPSPASNCQRGNDAMRVYLAVLAVSYAVHVSCTCHAPYCRRLARCTGAATAGGWRRAGSCGCAMRGCGWNGRRAGGQGCGAGVTRLKKAATRRAGQEVRRHLAVASTMVAYQCTERCWKMSSGAPECHFASLACRGMLWPCIKCRTVPCRAVPYRTVRQRR